MSNISPVNLLDDMSRLRALAQAERSLPVNETPATEEGGFGALLRQQVEDVNELKQDSKALAQAFELGDPSVSLVDVMISSQKASVSFQALTEVRNKFLNAYQEIMSMSV